LTESLEEERIEQANDLSTCRTKSQPCTCASDWLV
jgi:hypothetical protein